MSLEILLPVGRLTDASIRPTNSRTTVEGRDGGRTRATPRRAVTDRKSDEKLPVREQLFVAAYIAHGNATAAAKQAGFSAKTAYAKGSELLKRPRVAAALERAKQQITKKFKVNAERVVEEMAVVGFSDIRHYAINADGFLALAGGAPDSAMRAVKRFKRKIRSIPQKDAAPIVEVDSEIELWSKDTELRALGDYLAMFKENRRLDDDDDNDLTPAQREERIVQLLKVAAKRRKEAQASTRRRKK
jgi:hypothetical protein